MICQDGTIQEVQWRNIKVGDIVRVENCKEIPADLILLTSSEEQVEETFFLFVLL